MHRPKEVPCLLQRQSCQRHQNRLDDARVPPPLHRTATSPTQKDLRQDPPTNCKELSDCLTPDSFHSCFFLFSFFGQDSWAICRIFKKTNSTANRGISISHNWTPSLSTTTSSDAYTYTPFTSENEFQTLTALNIPSYTTTPSTGKTISTLTSANEDYFFPGNLVFSNKTTTVVDLTSPIFFNQSSPAALHGEAGKNSDSLDFFNSSSQVMQESSINGEDDDQVGLRKNISGIHHLWENIRFPFSLPAAQENLPWDSPPCPSEMSSTTYSTNKSYI